MNKQTRFFQTIGLALLAASVTTPTRTLASANGAKYLREEKNPAPVWAEIPTARDAFTQYEPPTKRLTASLHDIALHRYVTQRTR